MSRARNFEDLTGQRFERLVAIRFVETRSEKSYWLWRCDCGIEKVIYNQSVKLGRSRSCGCLCRERTSAAKTIHGAWRNGKETGAHLSWRNMIDRCYRPKNPRFDIYGGRGIEVCPAWHDFRAFLKDMGERPLGLTLERLNTNNDYSPSNCKWSTQKDQQNNRCNNHRLIIDGVSKTVAQWAEVSPISVTTIYARLYAGWSAKRSVFEALHQ